MSSSAVTCSGLTVSPVRTTTVSFGLKMMSSSAAWPIQRSISRAQRGAGLRDPVDHPVALLFEVAQPLGLLAPPGRPACVISGPVASSSRLVRSRSRASIRRSVSSLIWPIRRSRGLLVDVGDDVLREVQHLLQQARRHVQQQADPRGRALHEPDVADRRRKLDVAHPLATDLRARDLHAALVADDALVADPLVLAAGALPVLGGTENALAEQAVALRLERAVVDRLRLRHFAARPGLNQLWRGERDADRVEVVDLEHPTPSRAGDGQWVTGVGVRTWPRVPYHLSPVTYDPVQSSPRSKPEM